MARARQVQRLTGDDPVPNGSSCPLPSPLRARRSSLRVLNRFQLAVGGLGYIRAPHFDQRSGTYAHQWRADSFEEAQAVIGLLWGNLGAVKRAQARLAFRTFLAQYGVVTARWRTPRRARRIEMPAVGQPASPAAISRAWAAGLFDGEGSTELHARRHGGNRWFSLRARVSQCDDAGVPVVLERFQTVIGSGWIEGPTSSEGYETAYKWSAGAVETLLALEMLWPWIGSVKRVQAIEVMATVNSLPVRRRHAWRDTADRLRAAWAPSAASWL